VTARTTAVMRRSAGMMSNIVPLRLRVGHDITVAELLRPCADGSYWGHCAISGYRHEDIRRDSARGRNGAKEFFGPWGEHHAVPDPR